MAAETRLRERIATVLEAYGGDWAYGAPSAQAWERLANLGEDQRVTLINFFKFRTRARYPASYADEETNVSGKIAFDRYAAVSGNCLTQAGGRFLLVAPSGGAFIGNDEDWDLVAVGAYPNAEAVVSLFEQPEYRSVYVHRTAACEAQRVTLCLG